LPTRLPRPTGRRRRCNMPSSPQTRTPSWRLCPLPSGVWTSSTARATRRSSPRTMRRRSSSISSISGSSSFCRVCDSRLSAMMNHYRTRPGRAWRARWPRRAALLGMVGLLALLPALGVAQEGAPAGEQPPLGQARATVFLMQVYESRGRQFISCVGSGTLVSPDGLILTHAPNAQESLRCRADAFVAALTVNADEPPVPTYYAEIVVADAGLDLAVLRIARHLDGRLVLQNEIILPFVELGDSDALAIGDRVTIVGYPGIGQDPVEAYTGAVSAFMAEARAGDRAWIKTTASAPGVISGGGAYDRAGRLVGIPTIAPAGAGTQTIDCRAVQDTNTDGLIDSNDRCI